MEWCGPGRRGNGVTLTRGLHWQQRWRSREAENRTGDPTHSRISSLEGGNPHLYHMTTNLCHMITLTVTHVSHDHPYSIPVCHHPYIT